MRCLSDGAFRLPLSGDTFMEGDRFHEQEEKGMAGMYGSNCIDLVGGSLHRRLLLILSNRGGIKEFIRRPLKMEAITYWKTRKDS